MTKVLYFDAFSGVSGDMTVAALIALGADLDEIRTELATLSFGDYSLRCERRMVNGICARKFDVDIPGSDPSRHHHHHHRPYREIREMLQRGGLRPPVLERALGIFEKLAAAEAAVHAVPPDRVTFHEVGAVDSIIDIVATAIALEHLEVDRIYTSPLPLGSGIVSSQHGRIPVPAPATVELLRGYPVRYGDGEGELVTPTGAAIVAALALPEEPGDMSIAAVGYGAGSRQTEDRPNLLRLVLGAESQSAREMEVVECNVDDMSPKLYEHVLEALLSAGARDVWLTAVQMKKGRPGQILSALVERAHSQAVIAVLLRETSSIGARRHRVARSVLPREQIVVETEYGAVSVKVARSSDGTPNVAPEYESCRRAARATGAALKEVYAAALSAARRR